MMMMGGNNQMSAQSEDGGSSGDNGMSNGNNGVRGDGMVLKKGPWTTAEDAVLTEYVRVNGEGNWNSIQKTTGLARCGKSCRLRWANHLRPNLKKGHFSPQEERTIIELHAKMGNKWARMAAQLPGRTDNEIKNYWNTRIKRRQRQGLPLYPRDIHPHYSQYPHHLHHNSQPQMLLPAPLPTTATTATSCFSFQTPIMSLHTSMMPSSLHPLHIPHRVSPLNFRYNPRLATTMSSPPNLHSLNSDSTPPPLNSPSGSTPPISSLPSPQNQPPFTTLPLFDYDFFHEKKRFKHDENHGNINNNNNFMLRFLPMENYSNRVALDVASSSSNNLYQPYIDSGLFYPFKTDQDGSSGDGLLEDMLQEAHMLAVKANGGGNEEMPKEMNGTATQQDQEEEEEDYSKLINDDGPTSMGMAINEWCNDSGESSERQPSTITDTENQLALANVQSRGNFP